MIPSRSNPMFVVMLRRRRGRPARHQNGGSLLVQAPSKPGDELQGGWSREQLLRMDDRFVATMERAIAAGQETGGVLDFPRRPPEDQSVWLTRARRNVMALVG